MCLSYKSLIIICAALFTLSAKGQLTPAFNAKTAKGQGGILRAKKLAGGTFFWSYFDASKRASLINLTENGKLRVLAENPPDVAFSTTTSILSSLKLSAKDMVNVGAENKVDLAKNVIQLGQRTASVNVLRDALYRLNESLYNSTCLDCSHDYFLDSVAKKAIGCSRCGNSDVNQAMSMDNYIKLFEDILNTAQTFSCNEAAEIESQAKIEESRAQIMYQQTQQMELEHVKDSLEKVISNMKKDSSDKKSSDKNTDTTKADKGKKTQPSDNNETGKQSGKKDE